MIWPADVSAWLVDLTSATGQVEGMMILAGLSLWYSAALASIIGPTLLAIRPWRNRE